MSLGLDLLDVWRGKLSLRRLRVIIDNLGPTSALARSLNEDGWTVTEYLLADIVDVLQIGNWMQTDTKKTKRPKPYPRPGSEERKNAAEVAEKRERRRQAFTQMMREGS